MDQHTGANVCNPPMTVYIDVAGCIRRQLDAAHVARYFELNGCLVTDTPDTADLLIAFTCGVTVPQLQESMELVRRLQGHPGELIVAGCVPGSAGEVLQRVHSGRTLTTAQLPSIDQLFPTFRTHLCDVPDANKPKRPDRSLFRLLQLLAAELQHSRVFLRRCARFLNEQLSNRLKPVAFLHVVNGCLANCSYCAVRPAVGSLRSKPLDECLTEYEQLLQHGYRRFVIEGEDVGAYGLDIAHTFVDLLDGLAQLDRTLSTGWTIHEFSPQWGVRYSEALLRTISSGRVRRMGFGIQSGSRRILRLMRRYDNLDALMTLLSACGKADPTLCRRAHFIVGFPSESDADFDASVDMMRRMRLEHYMLFPYSNVAGAPSHGMQDQVSHGVIDDRLRKVSNTLEHDGYVTAAHYTNYLLCERRRGARHAAQSNRG